MYIYAHSYVRYMSRTFTSLRRQSLQSQLHDRGRQRLRARLPGGLRHGRRRLVAADLGPATQGRQWLVPSWVDRWGISEGQVVVDDD